MTETTKNSRTFLLGAGQLTESPPKLKPGVLNDLTYKKKKSKIVWKGKSADQENEPACKKQRSKKSRQPPKLGNELPRILRLPLEVTTEQEALLALKVAHTSDVSERIFKARKLEQLCDGNELNTKVVTIRSIGIEISQGQIIRYAQSRRLNFNPKTDRAFLVFTENKWLIEARCLPRKKKKSKSKVYSYPTVNIVSGGLPSLGKRR
ncbi:hypothetical protein [Noviherbaspirillum galbum]|uniref:Uncharacterized protein n=1 Tax=Noviherbaspirillum galbum TaxID=2709383 RepID=A0A6B3SXI3_9BURK|nr:hypothetical protein [Noviherbaspirillum galbum]NEX62479.1 hypothetical protein [Noviherbaspirillum galbum]